jgi:hypothetical protein
MPLHRVLGFRAILRLKQLTAALVAFSFILSPMQVALAQEPGAQANLLSPQTPETTDTQSEPNQQSEEVTSEPRGISQTAATEGSDAESSSNLLTEDEPNFPFAYERLSHASVPKLTPDESTGALRYSFPIVIPPGRNGLQPELELTYDSSNSKNEYLGLGWATNIPYIERINRTGAENLYDNTYFLSSFDGKLREITATSTGELMMSGGGAPSEEDSKVAEGLSEGTFQPSLDDQESIMPKLEGKTAVERADIKAAAIALRVPPGEYENSAYGIRVEIQSIDKIDRGVQIFVRAWKGDKQLGFGKDGSVEIERFRIFNPPILVDDPNGEIVREWTDDVTGELRQRKLHEDPTAAIREDLAHTISIAGKESTAIIEGKRGNTTDTFHPDGHPESTSVDGQVNRAVSNPGETWATLRTSAGNDSRDSSENENTPGLYSANTSNQWVQLKRLVTYFDTSALPDTDSIDSATLSLKGNGSKSSTFNTSATVVLADTASNTGLVNTDYNIANWTMTAQNTPDITIASWSTSAFNDFSLNATGRSNISVTGVSQFGVVTTADRDNSAPTWSSGGATTFGTTLADEAGTASDPALVIEHSPGNAPPEAPVDLLTEGQTNPINISDNTPEFSAVYNDPNPGDLASVYRIQVSTTSTFSSTI